MSDPLCIWNTNVVDVSAGAILPNRSVDLQGGTIRAITDAEPERPMDAIDATGSYLSPGLIDCHVHFFLDAGNAPRISYLESDDQTKWRWAGTNARVAIEAGITTMRDCAAPADFMFEFQHRVACGEIPGPHIISCGHALMRPGGHCHFMGGEVGSVEDVRRLAEHHLDRGAGFVKLMASGGGLTPGTLPHEADLPLELMREAVAVARERSVQITAHCHATESIERAVSVGLDMIEHVNFVEPPGRYRYDEETAKRIRDQEIVVSPTVFCGLQAAKRFRETGKPHNPGDVAAVERLEGRLTNTSHFYRLGMKIIAGTDCGATNTPFNSLQDELLAYAKAGLSNEEALRTATSKSAEFMSLRQVGEVREGYRADLVLLGANPLEDLNALRRPVKVFKSGKVVHPEGPT